jgi:ribonuclease J
MTDRVIPAGAPAGPLGDPTIEPSVRVIPLGGLGEIGLNMMLLEAGEDLLAIDCGLMFPDDELPGIDYVIPDFAYLRARREQVRGVILTHAHEDHIGALPYLLRELDVPVYGPRMALASASASTASWTAPGSCRSSRGARSTSAASGWSRSA